MSEPIAHERHETFDTRRHSTEAIAADAEDIKALEAIEKKANVKKDRK